MNTLRELLRTFGLVPTTIPAHVRAFEQSRTKLETKMVDAESKAFRCKAGTDEIEKMMRRLNRNKRRGGRGR